MLGFDSGLSLADHSGEEHPERKSNLQMTFTPDILDRRINEITSTGAMLSLQQRFITGASKFQWSDV